MFTSVTHAILRLLSDGPKHGYELKRQLPALSHLYPLSNVNVYPILKNLEDQGCVLCQAQVVGSRYRRIYEITAKGEQEFDRWLEQEPDEFLAVGTDVVSLKLVLTPTGKTEKVAWLARGIAQLDEAIAACNASQPAALEGSTTLASLAADYRLSSLEHRRAYLEVALRIAGSLE